MCSEMEISDKLHTEKVGITFGKTTKKQSNEIDNCPDSLSLADKNNNSNNGSDNTSENYEFDEDDNDSQVSFDSSCALDLSMYPSSYGFPLSFPTTSHVTLETLQNTKVAVAQFAATAIANTKNYDEAVKDLAVVQSTLFHLHHQQMLQIQLIHELQSRLSNNQKDNSDDSKVSEKNDTFHEKNDSSKISKTFDIDNKQQNSIDLINTKTKVNNNSDSTKEVDSKFQKPSKSNNIEITTIKPSKITELPKNTENDESTIKRDYLTQPSLCHISSSLASSIITNHDPLPPPDEPNSLEMLQKKAQEVLNSASQGILATNLADEIALRKNNFSEDGKESGDGFFKHRCKYCGKIFGSDSALQIHIRSHTGERPFECDVCGSKFTTKGNLKVHYQRHTQRYPCGPFGPIPEYFGNYAPPSLENPLMNQMTPCHMQDELVRSNESFSNSFPIIPPLRPPIELTRSPEHKKLDIPQEEPTDLSKPSTKNTEVSTSSKNFEETKSTPLHQISIEQNNALHRTEINLTIEKEKLSEKPLEISTKIQSIKSPLSSSSSQSNGLSQSSHPLPSITKMITNANLESDKSWESLIEISKPSETSKLQQLVDNIENKLADPNQCVFCQKILSCRSALQMHHRTHTGERPYRCRICGRAFATKGNLKAHMIIHKIKPPIRSQFKCPVCHSKFSNSMALQEHIKISHTKEAIENFQRRMHQNIGMDENTSMTDNTISETSEFKSSESSQGDFDEYMEIVDDEDDDIGNENDDIDDDATTDNEKSIENNKIIDFRLFSSRNSILDHSENKSISNLSNSDIALDLTPKTKNATNENGELNALENNNKYPPYIPFRNFGNFSNHIIPLQHSSLMMPSIFNQLAYPGFRGTTTCDVCNKTFSCASALEIHYRSHTKERPFKCLVCDKTFSTKKEESLHYALHHDNKNGNLKQHFFAHRQYDAFQQNSNKTKYHDHMTSHKSKYSPLCHDLTNATDNDHESSSLSESPINLTEDDLKDEENNQNSKYTTPDLEKSIPEHHIDTFEPSSVALDHSNQNESKSPQSSLREDISITSNYESLNSNSDQFKHFCTVCRRNFSSTSALQIHMRTHTGDKPFRCHICQKAFTTKGNLKVHMSTHMWTNSASRRGRRMSLDFPVGRSPITNYPIEPDYLQRRMDMFYPYIPPISNGIHQKLNDMMFLQSTSFHSPTSTSPSNMSTKLPNAFGFNPFLTNPLAGFNHMANSFPLNLQEYSANSKSKENSSNTSNGDKSKSWTSNNTKEQSPFEIDKQKQQKTELAV